MKKIIFFYMLVVLSEACNPVNKRGEFQGGLISINSSVLNPRTTISLGDSVSFYFEVPDTVIYNGNKFKATATNIDAAEFGFYANKIIDTSFFGSTNDPSKNDCKTVVSFGSVLRNSTLIFSIRNGKLLATLHLIPQKKGVYFFEQLKPGIVALNNNGLKASFTFNFGNINRNHQLLIDSAKAAPSFASWIQSRTNEGMEIYGFEVK